MWLSRQIAAEKAQTDGAAAATVSVGGEAPAVVTDGERRQARLFSPGGYCWRPGGGDTVLVVGSGEPCVAGREQKCPVALETGEIYLYSRGASIHLKNNGEIVVRGKLIVRGGAEITGGLTVDGAAVRGGI